MRAGKKRFGAPNFRRLQLRLDALIAAPTLETLRGAPGSCHELTEDRKGQLALNLWGQFRLVFEPDHLDVPRLEDGGLDWTQVTRVVILEVANYHGR